MPATMEGAVLRDPPGHPRRQGGARRRQRGGATALARGHGAAAPSKREDYALADRILNSIAREVGDLRQMREQAGPITSDDDRLRALMALINKVTGRRTLPEETRRDKTEET